MRDNYISSLSGLPTGTPLVLNELRKPVGENIVERVTNWKEHPPEQIKTMKDTLATLKKRKSIH